MISAKEAKSKAVGEYEGYLVVIEAAIERAVEKGQLEIVIREEPYCYWLFNPDSYDTKPVNDILNLLKTKGYSVSIFYEEKQFADLGLRISWACPTN